MTPQLVLAKCEVYMHLDRNCMHMSGSIYSLADNNNNNKKQFVCEENKKGMAASHARELSTFMQPLTSFARLDLK